MIVYRWPVTMSPLLEDNLKKKCIRVGRLIGKCCEVLLDGREYGGIRGLLKEAITKEHSVNYTPMGIIISCWLSCLFIRTSEDHFNIFTHSTDTDTDELPWKINSIDSSKFGIFFLYDNSSVVSRHFSLSSLQLKRRISFILFVFSWMIPKSERNYRKNNLDRHKFSFND